MSETVVMTLRLAPKVARSIERLANRFGYKPAQLGARLLDEGLRRRDHPLVDLRETAAGRIAYVGGTRLAVYWIKQRIDDGMTMEEFATMYELPTTSIRAALAYAQAYSQEIRADIEEADANREWIEQQDAACRAGHGSEGPAGSGARTRVRR